MPVCPMRLYAMLFATACACTTPVIARDAATPRVVVSVPPVHSLVAAVMAGVAPPELLIPASASPHTFSLRPSDARALSSADIVVWVGPTLETSLTGPLATLAGQAQLVTLSTAPDIELLPARAADIHDDHGVERDESKGKIEKDGDDHQPPGPAHDIGHDRRDIDPHLWLDTANAGAIVTAVAAALIAHDPARKTIYEANRDAALARLAALAERLASRLVPVAKQPFIVMHDSYQYFERQFGLDAADAIAISPEVRPGARHIAELRDHARRLGAVCVFTEPQIDPALAHIVAEGTGAQIGVLDPLGIDLEPGPALYPRLMENLAGAIEVCLTATSEPG